MMRRFSTTFIDILALIVLGITTAVLGGGFIYFCMLHPLHGLGLVWGAAVFWALVHVVIGAD